MVPYNPLTATEQRTRWHAAVSKAWDFVGLRGELPPHMDRPGLHPEHVMDFHDGLRLLVSNDMYAPNETYLHVSASARPQSPLYGKIKAGKMNVKAFSELVRQRVRFLSGREITLAYITDRKGVPHFFDPPLPVAWRPTDV